MVIIKFCSFNYYAFATSLFFYHFNKYFGFQLNHNMRSADFPSSVIIDVAYSLFLNHLRLNSFNYLSFITECLIDHPQPSCLFYL